MKVLSKIERKATVRETAAYHYIKLIDAIELLEHCEEGCIKNDSGRYPCGFSFCLNMPSDYLKMKRLIEHAEFIK